MGSSLLNASQSEVMRSIIEWLSCVHWYYSIILDNYVYMPYTDIILEDNSMQWYYPIRYSCISDTDFMLKDNTVCNALILS